MKLVSAFVPRNRLLHVQAAVFRFGVTGITLGEAIGPGHAADRPLVLEVAVPEPVVELTVAAIASAAPPQWSAGATIRVQSLERVIPIAPGDGPPARDGG